MSHDKLCREQIMSGVKNSLDKETFEKTEHLIESCIEYVVHNVGVQCEDKETFVKTIDEINSNAVNVIMIFVQQLMAFGGGNEGPFIDMCNQLMKDHKIQ